MEPGGCSVPLWRCWFEKPGPIICENLLTFLIQCDAFDWSVAYFPILAFDVGAQGHVDGLILKCMVSLQCYAAWEFKWKNNMRNVWDLGFEPRSWESLAHVPASWATLISFNIIWLINNKYLNQRIMDKRAQIWMNVSLAATTSSSSRALKHETQQQRFWSVVLSMLWENSE